MRVHVLRRRNVRLVIIPVPLLLLLGTAVIVSIVVIIMLVVLVVRVCVALLTVPVIIVVVALALGVALALLISRHGGRSVYGQALDILLHLRVREIRLSRRWSRDDRREPSSVTYQINNSWEMGPCESWWKWRQRQAIGPAKIPTL